MAQHGYLREYDEGSDRGDDRDRWRNEERERGWRGEEGGGKERDRDFMLENRDRDDDRGFFDRIGDRSRSWLRDDDREARGSGRDRWSGSEPGTSHYGREHGYGGFQGDFGRSGSEQGGFGGRGDWDRTPRNFSNRQDDHYRSWRDKQMEALDRDYADYCREREQRFHSDFDAWRSQRHGNQQPLQTGMTQTAQTGDPTGELELTNEVADQSRDRPDPIANATLGTTSERPR
jgi:hypothetical protein